MSSVERARIAAVPEVMELRREPSAAKLSEVRTRVLFGTLLLIGWALVVISRVGRGNDFVSFYAAGWLARTHPHHLYSLASQIAAQRAAGGTYPMPWLHPAPEAWLFVPLTYLSPPAAFAVWSAVSVAMFGGVLSLLRGELLALRPEAHYALIAFLYTPLIFGLRTGQDHVLFLLLWTLVYRSLQKEQYASAGVFIGLSFIRYQFALPVLLLLMVMRAWKVIFYAAMAGALIMVASFLMVGRNLVPAYTTALRVLAFHHDIVTVGTMPTLRGILSHAPDTFSLLGIAVVALLVWAAVAVERLPLSDGVLLALPVAMLLDIHGFGYELVVLLLPLLALLRRHPKAVWIPWGCFGCYILGEFGDGWDCLAGLFVLFIALLFRKYASRAHATQP